MEQPQIVVELEEASRLGHRLDVISAKRVQEILNHVKVLTLDTIEARDREIAEHSQAAEIALKETGLHGLHDNDLLSVVGAFRALSGKIQAEKQQREAEKRK